ncbi:DUF2255 family protein [Pedobacter cryoconitis]|uniref:Uncharacterized protein DUF2255 n=1 Tax=Pedobacter cryoconitis TaxID=188932 RepID=A0A327SJR7_9SPHI|nr:DUF2255 family protein [Pedobacter cryoconitis]RAJ28144.1 uncharacterized protein DUF2255 [Pedobacter cryoconitis]
MNKENLQQELINYVNSNTLVEIKGGTSRVTFLEIWMVSVGHRIFARSWGMSNKSWFTEFIAQGVGQLKLGEHVIDVRGQQLKDDEMNSLIDHAYQDKYIQKENEPYVNEITELKYHNFTMEFFPVFIEVQ